MRQIQQIAGPQDYFAFTPLSPYAVMPFIVKAGMDLHLVRLS